MKLRKAVENELHTILSLYNEVKGSPGCVWDEEYPDMVEIEADFHAECLYVLEKEEQMIGVVSVVPEEELGDLEFWKQKDGIHKELARAVIRKDQQGNGYAKEMFRLLFEELKAQNVQSVRLLAAKINPAAIRTYEQLGFSFLGEYFTYGYEFYVCEKCI